MNLGNGLEDEQADALNRDFCKLIASNSLFEKDQNAIGEYVQINGINFKVVGVFEATRMGGPQADIHIPFTTFQQIYNIQCIC